MAPLACENIIEMLKHPPKLVMGEWIIESPTGRWWDLWDFHHAAKEVTPENSPKNQTDPNQLRLEFPK